MIIVPHYLCKPHNYITNRKISGQWNNIVTTKRTYKKMGLNSITFKLKVISLFWIDKWVASTALKVKYSSLYALDTRKKCVDRFFEDFFIGHWRSCPHEAGLTSELNNLQNDLSSVQLVNRTDTWKSS